MPQVEEREMLDPYAAFRDWRLACGWLAAEIQRYACRIQTPATQVGGAYGGGGEGVVWLSFLYVIHRQQGRPLFLELETM